MNIIDLTQYLSDGLYFIRNNDDVYLVDDYHLGDKEWDYGICAKLSAEEMMDGVFDLDYIPDIFFDDLMDFLLWGDLENNYDVDEDCVEELKETEFCNWDIVLKRRKAADYPLWLNDMCKLLRGEEELDSIPEEELLKHCEDVSDNKFLLGCIENFGKMYDDYTY